MRDKENPPPVVAPHGGKQCCAYLFARAINQSAHYAHKHTYLHKTYTVYYTPVDKHNVLHTYSYTSHILTLTYLHSLHCQLCICLATIRWTLLWIGVYVDISIY